MKIEARDIPVGCFIKANDFSGEVGEVRHYDTFVVVELTNCLQTAFLNSAVVEVEEEFVTSNVPDDFFMRRFTEVI